MQQAIQIRKTQNRKKMKNAIYVTIIATLIVCSCKSEIHRTANQVDLNSKGKSLPISIAFLNDVSGSRSDFNIPEFKVTDIEPAINYVVEHGGAVMFGKISANSDQTTVQFFVDPSKKPEKPYKPRESQYSDRFSYQNAVNIYEDEILPEYEANRNKYNSEIQEKAEDFKKQVQALIDRKIDPHETDIGDGINRSINFHNLAPSDAKLVTVLISDGIDTQKNTTNCRENSNIELYLAYGSTNPTGGWVEKCKPIITPDLKFAFTKIIN